MNSLRRRRLQVEAFEPRHLMAAYINEIHFDPLFGNTAEDQYIELRGTPNSALETGTYLVAVGAADGVYELGDVHAIFDLSRVQFGANGLLVLMESGGGYSVNPQSKLLKGTDGFRGILNGIFSADGNAAQIRVGSNNFFLIQSALPPTLNTDIDVDDNGLPEGAYLNWTILDGVGVLPFNESAWKQRSYAPITFREQNVGAVMPGTTSVATDSLAYVARLDRSTGYAPEDWLAANTVELDPKPSWRFQIQHGSFGAPRPYAYGGRMLDHVGSDNWFGAISGAVFQDDNKDGIQQPGEAGIAGVTVRASLASDANVGYEVAQLNPDNYALGADVSNALPYVTLISASATNVPQGFKIRTFQRALSTAGDYIFAHEGVGFFYEDRRLRMDFYHPAQGVSIDVIGNSDLTMTYGRLEIFNSANQSLGMVRTNALGAGKRQRLSLSSNNDIAWALAYSDNNYLSSSSFGMFENLEVVVPENVAVTDSNGRYSFPTLPAATYQLTATKPALYDFVTPNSSGQRLVNVTGSDLTASKNFGLQGNRPPQIDDKAITVSELLPIGTVLTNLPVVLGYSAQRVKYTILAGDAAGKFSMDAAGNLILSSKSLDFETEPTIQLTVRVEDTGSAALNDTALIDLMVQDGNEEPVVAARSVTLDETVATGTNVTTMSAVDPDAGQAGVITWSIAGGNIGGAFAINSSTGVVTVQDASKIDYEQLANYALLIRATDKGSPALFGQATLSITIADINEAPVIAGQALFIKENSLAGTIAGTISATDPDRNQVLQWQVTGGSGQPLFEVNSANGEVRLLAGARLNFEQTNQYQLQVKVTDSGSPALSSARTISIVVLDDNDAPTLTTTSLTLAENVAANSLVGTVAASDEDATQRLQFSLSGGDAVNFTIDASTGQIRTAAGKQFNFEDKSQYIVTVTVIDNGDVPKQVDAPITISVTNVNEAPTIVTTAMTVAENSAAGSKIGSLSALDEDKGDVLHWSLLSQAPSWFTIDELTGELTVAAGSSIDFESTKQSVLSVRVTDTAGLSANSTITVSVLDRNDPPTASASSLGSVTAKANQPFSFALPANAFSDPDAGDKLNIFITKSNGFPLPSWLSYNSTTRLLTGTPSVSDAGPLAIKITAVDQGGLSAVSSLTVTVDGNLFPWHNTQMPLDVSGDSHVTARDALLIINYLNTIGPGAVPSGSDPRDGLLDTSGDNSVSARDVLLVINELNQQAAGEGELAIDPDQLLKRKAAK